MKNDLLDTQLLSITANGYYIKQLSFDNINTPASFVEQTTTPKMKLL